jgi:hypothetical protein
MEYMFNKTNLDQLKNFICNKQAQIWHRLLCSRIMWRNCVKIWTATADSQCATLCFYPYQKFIKLLPEGPAFGISQVIPEDDSAGFIIKNFDDSII